MSTPTVQAGQACQEFNRLIDYISSAPEDNSASANAALLAISKLPLVREVMKELELGVEGSMVIESNNAFATCFRGIYGMFDRLAVKLEDRPVASKFLQQLREVADQSFGQRSAAQSTTSIPSTPAPSFSGFKLAPGLPRRGSVASYAPSSAVGTPIQHETSTGTRPRSDRGRQFRTAKFKEYRQYDSDYDVSETESDFTVGNNNKSTPASHVTTGMKRPREPTSEEELGRYAPVKRANVRGSSSSSPAAPLSKGPGTAWQSVNDKFLQLPPSVMGTACDRAQIENAFRLLKMAVEAGYERFFAFLEAYKESFRWMRGLSIEWPADLSESHFPALRRYQEAEADYNFALVSNDANKDAKGEMLCYLRLAATDDLLSAYEAANPSSSRSRADIGIYNAYLKFGERARQRLRFWENYMVLGILGHRGEREMKERREYWSKLRAYYDSYGPGFYALLPRRSVHNISSTNVAAIRYVARTIDKHPELASNIRKACDEAHRLVLALWDDKYCVSIKDMDLLEELLAAIKEKF